MKQKSVFYAFCLIVFYSVILMACGRDQDYLPLDFDEGYLNQQITLRAPKFFNSFNTVDDISLEITNNSNYEVIFPNNYNIRVFSFLNDKWVEISEIPTIRLPDGDFVLSPRSNVPTKKNIFTVPDVPDLARQYQLKIYVSGIIKVNGNSIVVAAFTDVTLRP